MYYMLAAWTCMKRDVVAEFARAWMSNDANKSYINNNPKALNWNRFPDFHAGFLLWTVVAFGAAPRSPPPKTRQEFSLSPLYRWFCLLVGEGVMTRCHCMPGRFGWFTFPETNSSPLKIGDPKRKRIFQPSIFRCHTSFRERIKFGTKKDTPNVFFAKTKALDDTCRQWVAFLLFNVFLVDVITVLPTRKMNECQLKSYYFKRKCHLRTQQFSGDLSFKGGQHMLMLDSVRRPHHRNRRRALENRIAHFLGKPFLGVLHVQMGDVAPKLKSNGWRMTPKSMRNI